MRMTLCAAAVLWLSAAWAGEEAPPVPVPKVQTPPAAEAPAAGQPKFPLVSPRFKGVIDSYDEQDEARIIDLEAMGDILTALKASSLENLKSQVDPAADFKALMKEPQKFRGAAVDLSGILRSFDACDIEKNASGIEKAHIGRMSNSLGYIVTFVSIEPLPEGLKPGQGVKAAGVFLKRYAYENKMPGGKLQWSPLVFVKCLRFFSELEETEKPRNFWGISFGEVLFCLAALAIVAVIGYQRQQSKVKLANPYTRKKEKENKKT